MSIRTSINKLPQETRERVSKDLQIKLESKYGMGGPEKYIQAFTIINDDVTLPFAYAARTLKIKRPLRTNFPPTNVKFVGTLRPKQLVVKKEALKLLSGKGSVMVSCHTGFGKTIGAINLTCAIGFKTLVIVNKIILMKQWEASILKFCPDARVQRLTTKSKKKDCDFYIMNAQNVAKMGKTFFNNIGTVVVDEAHLIMAETLCKSLEYVYPRYLIGLTATPFRPDGLNILLELYFGKYKIIRKLHRPHTVYKVTTGFKPKVEYMQVGHRKVVKWSSVLESQANDVSRNALIIKIIQHFSDRNFLVLVKRVDQGNYLVEQLTSLGEDVTSLIGSNQEFNDESRILIGTTQKCGTGFDHPKLDTLIMAADVEGYFSQYLGRVFRTEDVKPIIFDLVDDYRTLTRHFNTRCKSYRECGGQIEDFDISVLDY